MYLPYWLMHNFLLEEGDFLQIESGAIYSRFQPQSIDFLDITNPKTVLENGYVALLVLQLVL
jgi:ubiquitin fusion degradation protein 1